MSETIRETYRQQMLKDYPRFAECPQIIDNLIEAYFIDPVKFKETVKENEKKDKKVAKKGIEKFQKPTTVVIENGISKIDAENVTVGARPLPVDEAVDTIEDGMKNVEIV
jgi:hypothetical protein